MNKMKQWILCKVMDSHDWTSKAEQGVPGKFKSWEEFMEHSKSYCSRCGKVNRHSQELMDEERKHG